MGAGMAIMQHGLNERRTEHMWGIRRGRGEETNPKKDGLGSWQHCKLHELLWGFISCF